MVKSGISGIFMGQARRQSSRDSVANKFFPKSNKTTGSFPVVAAEPMTAVPEELPLCSSTIEESLPVKGMSLEEQLIAKVLATASSEPFLMETVNAIIDNSSILSEVYEDDREMTVDDLLPIKGNA